MLAPGLDQQLPQLLRVDMLEREAMLQGNPDVFFTTPHYDGYPAVLVRLPAVGLDELRELVTESWRLKAPVRARKLLDAG